MRFKSSKPENCVLCRRCVDLTFHHLIPRKVHRRTYFRKHMSRETLHRGIWVCRTCHRAIHKRFSEMELARFYNSIERLREDDALSRHFEWVARQKSRKQV